ncbi:hypothetical protein ACRRTK_017241 [Alexandromys fortis]
MAARPSRAARPGGSQRSRVQPPPGTGLKQQLPPLAATRVVSAAATAAAMRRGGRAGGRASGTDAGAGPDPLGGSTGPGSTRPSRAAAGSHKCPRVGAVLTRQSSTSSGRRCLPAPAPRCPEAAAAVSPAASRCPRPAFARSASPGYRARSASPGWASILPGAAGPSRSACSRLDSPASRPPPRPPHPVAFPQPVPRSQSSVGRASTFMTHLGTVFLLCPEMEVGQRRWTNRFPFSQLPTLKK